MLAGAVINSINHEALSALPNAPVIAPRPPRCTLRRLVRLQAMLASVLHRTAWAIETQSPSAEHGRDSHPGGHRGRLAERRTGFLWRRRLSFWDAERKFFRP